MFIIKVFFKDLENAPSDSLRQWADRLIGERKTLKPKQPEPFKLGLVVFKPHRHIDKQARMAEIILAYLNMPAIGTPNGVI